MRRLFVASCLLAFAVLGTGCAEWQKIKDGFNAVTERVATPEAIRLEVDAFNAYESLAESYNHLRLCNGSNGPICRDPAVRRIVRASVYSGRSARNNLLAYLRANCKPDPNNTTQLLCGNTTPPQVDFNTLATASNQIQTSLQDYKHALNQ